MKIAAREPADAARPSAVTPESPARVVLLGRTGLDGALRLDRAVQLARARGPLDAVGELADLTDDADPRPACVIVGPGAVERGREAALVDALRRIDPAVRVLSTGAAPEAAPGFDGVLSPTVAPAALRAIVRGLPAPAEPGSAPAAVHDGLAASEAAVARRAAASEIVVRAVAPVRPAPRPAPVTNGTAHHAPEPTAATPAAPPTAASAAPRSAESPVSAQGPVEPEPDGPLAAVLGGRDPVGAALEALSARLAVPCAFTPAQPHGSPAADEEPDAPVDAVPVVHAGRTLGRLLAPGVARPRAEAEARWLAGWIALAQQQDQLRRAAFTDELTGAWNRRYFHRFLGAAIDHARAARHSVTLLYFDIDNFKTYNDRYGHAAGDEILVQAVKLLSSGIRPSDRVCRIGGDEFCVVFHDPEGPRTPGPAAPASIAQIAARFQRQICEHRFPKLAGEAPGTLTISGGMATFPWDGGSVQELLDRADELALQSKRQGKNAITFGPGALRVCGTE